MKNRLNIFVLYFLCLIVVSDLQATQTLLGSTSYWVDESGESTFLEAEHASYTDFSGVLNKGYTKSTVWIKVKINARQTPTPLAIKINPPFLREIALFDPFTFQGTETQPSISGRENRTSDTSFQMVSPSFILPASSEPRFVYLRIKTTTSLVVYLDVEPLDEAIYNDSILQNILSIYLGFLFLTCIWGLINWIIQRDFVYGWFSVRQVASTLHVIAYYGLYSYVLRDNISTTAGDHYYLFSMVSTALVVFSFDVWLLGEFGVWSKLRKIMLYAIGIMLPLFVFLLFSNQPMDTLKLNSIFISIYSILTIILAFSARTNSQLPLSRTATHVIRIGYLIKFLIVLVPVLVFQGIMTGNSLTLNMIVVHAAISSIIVLLLLAIRSRQQAWIIQQAEVQHSLDLASLESEKIRRKEKENFLSMLTHELRNPLSVININTPPENKAMREASQDMARLLERVQQSEKVDDEQVPVNITAFNLNKLLTDTVETLGQTDRFTIAKEADLQISSDEELMSSIFSNIFENAIKYSPAHSPVTVTVLYKARDTRKGTSIIIENIIGESGEPDEHQIFNKYYRTDGARHKIGSGLGLFLVKQWISSLNYEISYKTRQSEQGEIMACFTLWIPE